MPFAEEYYKVRKGVFFTDTKELQLLKTYHRKLEVNTFDEKDIYSFLTFIKKFAEKDTPTFELGDFIAQREKYKGPIRNYLLDAKTQLDLAAKEKAAIKIEPVFSFEEIVISINELMELYKLSWFSDEVNSGIVLCIISLLHDVKILNKKEEIGKLVFSIQNDQIVLSGKIHGKNKTDMIIPVIQVENKFCKIMQQGNEATLFDDGVKIKNVQNRLMVKFN